MIWNKFHPLECGLKVALETTFPKGNVLGGGWEEIYDRNGMLHITHPGSVKRIYDPATVVDGTSMITGETSRNILFRSVRSVLQSGFLYRHLVFTKAKKENCKASWVVAARHGEVATFGFDSWNSKDRNYLSLAYPGSTGKQFVPVYFKIQERKEGSFEYLEVWAFGDDAAQTLVAARRVEESAAPEQLWAATPEKNFS